MKKKKPTRKSKGKRHPAHAASFDHMANELHQQSQSNFPLYRDDLVRLFRKETARLRGIKR